MSNAQLVMFVKIMALAELAPPHFAERLKRYLQDVGRAGSEAGKAFLFLEFVRDVFKQVDMQYLEKLYPDLEKHLSGKAKTLVVKGRVDAFLGNLIVEFKKDLDKKSLEDACSELQRYVSILWTQQKKDRVSYIAIATDGTSFVAYRPRAAIEDELSPEDVQLDQIDKMNLTKTRPGDAFVWLDRYMLVQTLRPATSEAFSNEFGLNKPAFREAEGLLKQAWKEDKEAVLYEQWANFLRIVYGSSVDSEDLFIKHTYLATLAKLLVYSSFSGGALPVSSEQIAEILEGRIFETWNVHNFLEEDFFSWVARNPSGLKAASMLLARLASYDLTTIDEDILKSLYQELVDPQARHDLGEYYTPDWLCEMMVKDVLGKSATKTMLDPACGSGTFLAAGIRRKKELLNNKKPSEQLEIILSSVKGVDVHPLAVILSRTNFLASLGTDLLSARRGAISVPVYLADSIRLPDLDVTLYDGVRSFNIEAEGKVLHLPLDVAENPLLTDRVIEAVKEYARGIAEGAKPELEHFENLLSMKIRSTGVKFAKNAPKVLLETAKTMAELIKAKKDTVWAFILKNIYKPLFLKDQKFDIVIGNPPWLSYRYIESTDYQKFLKDLILKKYNLLGSERAELITQMELATLFFSRASDLYLAKDGTISFVMPRSIFVGDQHHDFRKGTFTPKMRITAILDLEDVNPLFRVPSCVVTAEKGTNQYPINGIVFEGTLPQKNSRISEAIKSLTQTKKKFEYFEIGQRSFLESEEFGKVLKAIDRGQHSPYYDSFSQGATIVPHSFWFVEPIAHPRLGIDPTRPRLKTSGQATKMAKVPYRDVILEGEVESRFLYQVVTGSELAPFCTRTLQTAVLPIEPDAGHYHIVTSEEAQRRGFSGLRNWLAIAERTWMTKRGEKADKLDIYQRLDYSRGLTSQSSKAKYRVLYNKDGTYLVACVLENRSSSLKADSSLIRVSGVCADDTILHFDISNLDEAMFIVAILNAPIVDSLIKPMQSRGQWGERHIQKKVLELPLPRFEPKNKKHMELVGLAKQAQAKAEKTVGKLEEKYASIGKIRSMLKAELSEELLQIDKIVRELIVHAGNLPNTLGDFLKK
jgi:hypothetical protein